MSNVCTIRNCLAVRYSSINREPLLVLVVSVILEWCLRLTVWPMLPRGTYGNVLAWMNGNAAPATVGKPSFKKPHQRPVRGPQIAHESDKLETPPTYSSNQLIISFKFIGHFY